jgi:hypothetical protein
VIATSAQRDFAANEDRVHRLAILGDRSEQVLAQLVINARGDDYAIELPNPLEPTPAPQEQKERRFARAFRRVTGI